MHAKTSRPEAVARSGRCRRRRMPPSRMSNGSSGRNSARSEPAPDAMILGGPSNPDWNSRPPDWSNDDDQRGSLPSRMPRSHPMSRLTEFYRGAGTDNWGRSLAEIWAFSDDELEGIHDFIQWMF